MTVYLVTFVSALALTVASTPVVIWFARATNLLDRPGLRKAHHDSVPRLGGVAIVFAVVATIAALAGAGSSVGWSLRDSLAQWGAFALGAAVVFALGLVDDVCGLRARRKLLIQIAAAGVVAASGIRVETVGWNGSFSIELGAGAWPLTILWIVGITNAVNLIDGLDGLAAGITAMAAIAIGLIALAGGQPVLALVMVAVTGALLGFLVFNFSPARIFLGDCGAMSIGFVLATASVASNATTGRITDLAIPALVLVVPILDTLHCIVRRSFERRSVFSPDRGHIHHRLLDIGLSHRGVSLVLYGVTAAAGGLGALMLATRGVGMAIIFVCVLLFVIVLLKAIGAMPLRENVIALQRSRAMKHIVQEVRGAFEHGRLRFENVRCFDEWWSALCAAAGDLHLSRMALWFSPAGSSMMEGYREWRASETQAGDRLRTTLLLRAVPDGPPGMMQLEAPVEGAFESASCRIQFLSRLIDENPPADLVGSVNTPEGELNEAAIPSPTWEEVGSGEDGNDEQPSLAALGPAEGEW